MKINDTLFDVCEKLESQGIEYMLGGSLAMSFYVIPRMTRDIDIVIHLIENEVDKFLSVFENHYYHKASIIEEVRKRGMFNLIDNQTGYKIDFMLLRDEKYHQTAFTRKKQLDIFTELIWVTSIEDLIIAKIRWIQEIYSDRQMNDIENLLRNPEIDFNYIRYWCKELNLNTFGIKKIAP
jgi:hypothetical protein